MTILLRNLHVIPPMADWNTRHGIPGAAMLKLMQRYLDKGYNGLTPLELFNLRRELENPSATYVDIETHFIYEFMRMGYTDDAIEQFFTSEKAASAGFSKLSFITCFPAAAQKFYSWIERVGFIPPGFVEQQPEIDK